MSWAKIDDGMPENLKIEALSDAAFRAYVTGICYAARNLTDGFISPKKAKEFAGRGRVIQELVPALWTVVDDGYVIHDYLEYNPTREEVMAERAKREAGRTVGGKARAASGVRDQQGRFAGASNASSNGDLLEPAKSPAPPRPVPSRPLPSFVQVEQEGARDEIGEVIAEYAAIGVVNDLTVTCVEEAIEVYTLDWVRRAVRVLAKSKAGGDRAPWEYVEAILRRWKKAGEPDDESVKETSNGRAKTPVGTAGRSTRGVITADELDEIERYRRGEID